MKNMVTCITRSKIQQFLTASSNFAWLLVIMAIVIKHFGIPEILRRVSISQKKHRGFPKSIFDLLF